MSYSSKILKRERSSGLSAGRHALVSWSVSLELHAVVVVRCRVCCRWLLVVILKSLPVACPFRYFLLTLIQLVLEVTRLYRQSDTLESLHTNHSILRLPLAEYLQGHMPAPS